MTVISRVVLAVAGLAIAGAAHAVDPNEFNIDRVPSSQGLTGLLMTSSAYTLRAGEVRAHITNFAEFYEYDDIAYTAPIDVTSTTAPFGLTVGLTGNWEVALLGRLHTFSADSSDPAFSDINEAGVGSSEILTKVHILSQSDFLPAIALGIGFINSDGANDDSVDFRAAEVWGARAMAMISTEMGLGDNGFIGFYAEFQAVTIDPSEDEYDPVSGDGSAKKADYSLINAGIRVPISDNNRLHLLAEYSATNGVADEALSPGVDLDFALYTASLRYAWRYLTAGVGIQSVTFSESALSDQERTRYIVNAGFGF